MHRPRRHQNLLVYFFCALLLLGCLVRTSTASECSATKHCESGCCSRYGFCGFSDDHCGSGCLSTCDAKPDIPVGGGGECSASLPCEIGCCSEYGNCGLGEEYCSIDKGCVNNCDRRSQCDPGWGSEWAESKNCPLNVCCSKYGFCGTTEEFCGEDDKVKRPSCNVNDHSIDRVVGYYEEWSLTRPCNTMRPEQIPAGHYTHINFAFASINPETFEVVPSTVGDKSLWSRIQSIRIAQPGVEVWIALGGWKFNNADQPTDTAFSDIARSEDNQRKFADSLLSMMATYGFDGVDIDWEYPVALDRSGRKEDYENFPRWMDNLRSSLKKSGKKYGLSLTLPASYWYLQHFDIKSLEGSVDWFNIMSYDLHGTWDKGNEWVGPYINPHTNLTEIKDALDLLWRNDIQPANVVLGMAFYGRSFTLVSPDCFEPSCVYSSGGNAGRCSSTIGFLLNSEISQIIDELNLSPTLYEDAAVKAINWGDQWVSFDDEDTFKLKGDFAKSQCLGGAMVWAVSHDDREATFAKQLTSGLGREPIPPPNYNTPAPSTQEPPKPKTCRWTNCGEDCPSGWKWIDRDGTDQKMLDQTGCYDDQFGHKFCCPGDSELPICTWRGMPSIGNICSEGCEDDEVEVGSLSLEYCGIEHQSACCTAVESTRAYGQCTWVGSALICSESGGHHDCPDDYPNFLFGASQGAGGEQVCSQGAKSYCCKDVPMEFKDCSWHQKATHVFAEDYTCESSCPDGQIRLGMHSGSCAYGLEAYCCKGTEVITIPPDLPPRDPGHRYFQEYSSLIDAFMEHPDAPEGYESHSWFDSESDYLNRRSPKLDLYNFDMMNTYFIRSLDSAMESLRNEWDDYGPPNQFGTHLSTMGFTHFVSPSVDNNIDTYAVARDMNANVRTANEAILQMEQAREDLCVLPDEEEDDGSSSINTKRTLPETEGNQSAAPAPDKRHIDVFDTETSAQPPGSQPRMVTILRGIMNGQLTLHYARWQAYRDQGNNGLHAGPMLELAYWIGREIGVLGPNAEQFQENDDDQWVVFHVHFRNDNALVHRNSGVQTRRYFGVTRIQVYHGQHLRYYNNGADARVDGDDRDRRNELGRNTRARALDCPGARRWYAGEANVPDVTGRHQYAHILNEWGQMLYRQGYIGTVAFNLIYPPQTNGRFDFRPDNYDESGSAMRHNFLTEENPDWNDWYLVDVNI